MEGATAFARFYLAQLNNGFRSGDSRRVRELSSRTCKMCLALADGIDEVHAANNHYGGDLVTVRYATAAEFTKERRRVVLWINQNSVEVVNTTGRHVEKVPAAQLELVMTLEFKSRWIVARLQKAKS